MPGAGDAGRAPGQPGPAGAGGVAHCAVPGLRGEGGPEAAAQTLPHGGRAPTPGHPAAAAPRPAPAPPPHTGEASASLLCPEHWTLYCYSTTSWSTRAAFAGDSAGTRAG